MGDAVEELGIPAMDESLQCKFVSKDFLDGKLYATRVDGFPKFEKKVELVGETVEVEEAQEFQMVVRLVECRWQADEGTAPAPSPSSRTAEGADRPHGTATPRRRAKHCTGQRTPTNKMVDADPEVELNLVSDEITMGYFCRFALQTLAMQLGNRPQRKAILNHFREKLSPLWSMWLRHKISKTRLVAETTRLYEQQLSGGAVSKTSMQSPLLSMFSSWYFQFCRSRRRLDRVDASLNPVDPASLRG